MSNAWYWCLTHNRVEPAEGCPSEQRLGPYDSPDAARDWRERHEDRADGWKAQEQADKDAWDRADEAWDEPPA